MSLVVCGLAIGTANLPTKGVAQTQVSLATDPLVVRNDRGGLLRDRLRQIRQLRAERRPVEIRGAVCFSTCTMLIGLPNTCVSPNTTFGFHGPSSYGRPLDPETFNYASEVISSYYPAPLQNWYMETARFKIIRISRVKGAQLIEMGVRAC
ncbi:MAG: hypothetical protein AAFO97_12530 [Pseudomonadota bacterium]